MWTDLTGGPAARGGELGACRWRRFDRAFYLHTPQPDRCVGVISEPVRARLLEVRPNWVGVEEGQVQIGFDGVGGWRRRPLGTLAQTLQLAIELALDLAEPVEAGKQRALGRAVRRALAGAAASHPSAHGAESEGRDRELSGGEHGHGA